MMNGESVWEAHEVNETEQPKTSDSSSGVGRYSGMGVGACLGSVLGGPEGGIAGGLAGGVIGGTLERFIGGEPLSDAMKAEIAAVKNDIKMTAQQAEIVVKALGLDHTVVGQIVTSLSGLGEAAVYADEGLKGAVVGDEAALVRSDIDMDQKDPVRGWTNAERMEHGLPPLTPTGEPLELHRIGQHVGGPFAEMTNTLLGNIETAGQLYQTATGVVSDIKDFGQSAYNYWRDRVTTVPEIKS